MLCKSQGGDGIALLFYCVSTGGIRFSDVWKANLESQTAWPGLQHVDFLLRPYGIAFDMNSGENCVAVLQR